MILARHRHRINNKAALAFDSERNTFAYGNVYGNFVNYSTCILYTVAVFVSDTKLLVYSTASGYY